MTQLLSARSGTAAAAVTNGPSAGPARRPHVRVAVIGTGFAGLAAVHALREAHIDDFVVLERAPEVGGTWRDNSYPGIACDVPSHLYSLSFAPNPDWTRTFSGGAQIQAYSRQVARRLRMDEVTEFGAEVLAATWQETRQCWQIRTATREFSADAIIDGSGGLSDPAYPGIDGLARFRGTICHSARWDHDADLSGKRVAVIGTGASAVQIVPAIQPQVAAMTVFQRTPGWVLPRLDRDITRTERRLLRAFPLLQRALRGGQALVRDGVLSQVMHRRSVRRIVQAVATAHLRRAVADPALRAKLQPSFEIGCKRILISSKWYPALTQPNVQVETSPIRQVSEHAVTTADGREHPVDVIVLATGFYVTDTPIAARLHGRDGRSLAQTWGPSPRAYRGVTTANFPNLFRIGGAGTATGHISHILQIESGVRYAIGALRAMDAHGLSSVEVTDAAEHAYTLRIRQMLSGTVFVAGGCTSWYLDKSGQASAAWPSTARRYRRWTRRFDIENYHLTPRAIRPRPDQAAPLINPQTSSGSSPRRGLVPRSISTSPCQSARRTGSTGSTRSSRNRYAASPRSPRPHPDPPRRVLPRSQTGVSGWNPVAPTGFAGRSQPVSWRGLKIRARLMSSPRRLPSVR